MYNQNGKKQQLSEKKAYTPPQPQIVEPAQSQISVDYSSGHQSAQYLHPDRWAGKNY